MKSPSSSSNPKTKAAAAAAVEEGEKNQDEGGDASPANLRLDKLPHDAMSQVLAHCCSDFSTILNLANASEVFQATIYNQNWNCHRCSDPLFVGSCLETNKHAKPFFCGVCHKKICGESIDYDRRHCRPQKCDGCGKIECYDCQQAHMQDSDGYGTENYCEECQAEFEFGMGGC